MEKMKMHSPNMTQDNMARIREVFPDCVTEAQGADGKLKLAVDFDQLRQELSESIVEGPQERYRLDWPGKREALLTANAPIAKTLRPCREESVAFDTTKNLFIEGDNLDALKLLQETYLGKVKMIYIDPPYNTGNDFIYNDDFAETTDEFLKRSNQKDEDGNRLVANTESNGRFHSDWLSMMYPRLKLARNLLRDDGVILISIDDNEFDNLKKICAEIFGVENFVGTCVWRRRTSSAMAQSNISTDHESVLIYRRAESIIVKGTPKNYNGYANPDNDPRGIWVAGDLTVGMNADMRPNQYFDLVDPKTKKVYHPNFNRVWSYSPDSMQTLINENRVVFPEDTTQRPMKKRFANELKSETNPFSTWMTETGLNSEGTRAVNSLFDDKTMFNYAKPISLAQTLVRQITDSTDLILDFFAGSATTAHAVMQQNAEDGGNRQFIMVQLPEVCDEKSEAHKAGYATIAEISKERIRRAGKKILEGECHQGWNKDTGFRVLKVDSSNMAEVYYKPDELKQGWLNYFIGSTKTDRTPEDLLFQVLLDWGVDLTLPIRKDSIQGKTVFFVDDNALMACFDAGITEELVKELAGFKPLRAVFLDDRFASDAVKINTWQIFNQLSPGTEVKSI